MTKTCSVAGCGRSAFARGWCGKHYQRWYAHGDPTTYLLCKADPKPCSVEGCGRPVAVRSWCTLHYGRWRAHGDPYYRRLRAVCGVAGCGRSAKARGACHKHFMRLRIYLRDPEARPLSVPGTKEFIAFCRKLGIKLNKPRPTSSRR